MCVHVWRGDPWWLSKNILRAEKSEQVKKKKKKELSPLITTQIRPVFGTHCNECTSFDQILFGLFLATDDNNNK